MKETLRPNEFGQSEVASMNVDERATCVGSKSSGRWLALIALSLAQLMDVLDNTIVNIALPSAQHDLGFSIDNRQWVVTGYALAFGSLLLLGGRLADRFGRKRMFLIGVAGFAVASAFGGSANGFVVLLLARVTQGVFAAILAPAALSLVAEVFADNAQDRARAFGIFGVVSGVGGALGLLLGGVLTQTLSWRWCLYVNLVFGIVALIGALAFVPSDERSHRARLDFPGSITVVLGLVSIVYGLGNAASNGWIDVWTLVPMIFGIVSMIVFVLIQHRATHPLLPLQVVLDRGRGAAYLTLWISGIGMFAVFLFLTYYMQEVLKFSPVRTGVAFLPLIGAVVVSSIIFGAVLFPRVGPRPLVSVGCVLAAIGMAMFTSISATSGYAAHTLPALLVTGLGFGMIFSPAQNTATSGIRACDAGVASAMVNTVQQIGGSLGTAMFNSLAVTAAATYLKDHTSSYQPTMSINATLAATQLVFWAAAGVFLLGGIVAVILFRSGPIVINDKINNVMTKQNVLSVILLVIIIE